MDKVREEGEGIMSAPEPFSGTHTRRVVCTGKRGRPQYWEYPRIRSGFGPSCRPPSFLRRAHCPVNNQYPSHDRSKTDNTRRATTTGDEYPSRNTSLSGRRGADFWDREDSYRRTERRVWKGSTREDKEPGPRQVPETGRY